LPLGVGLGLGDGLLVLLGLGDGLLVGMGVLLFGLGLLFEGLGLLLDGVGLLLDGVGLLLRGVGVLLDGLGLLLLLDGLGVLLAGLGLFLDLDGLGVLLAGLGLFFDLLGVALGDLVLLLAGVADLLRRGLLLAGPLPPAPCVPFALTSAIPVLCPAVRADATMVAAGRLAQLAFAVVAWAAGAPTSRTPSSPHDSTAVPVSAPTAADPACRFLAFLTVSPSLRSMS
jgi:hypothetical protein